MSKKPRSPLEEKGNPSFNLKDAVPIETPEDFGKPMFPKEATNVVTPEDLALDREIERMAKESPMPAIDAEPAHIGVRQTKDTRELLSEFIEDYKPAGTIRDLEDQVQLAKVSGADSVECTMPLARYYVKDNSLETVGYFMFRDIKVYVDGFYEKAKARDGRSTWDIEAKR